MLKWTLLVVIFSGAAIETLVEPRAGLSLMSRRLAVSGCVAGLLMMMLLLPSGRPVFSAAAVVIVMIVITVASNVKFAVLREPLVAIDLAMLAEIPRHPRLFFPHVGVVPAALLAGAVCLGVATALELEAPVNVLPGDRSIVQWIELVGIGAVVLGVFRLLRSHLVGWAWNLRPSLDPRKDIPRFGLFGTLLLNALLLADQTGKDAVRQQRRRTLVHSPNGKLPDIVVVQAESFFDARLMDPRIDRALLPAFDACAASAVHCGRLQVPAWGAATQRTEFAFLTGLPEEALGLDRHNPYLRFARQPVWSIAHDLRELGYRTICVHPFFGSFFGRDRVMPQLGFDEFLDISAFEGAQRFGPYISDVSLADKIAGLLQEEGQPKFIFAITMENHGQWQKDRLPPEEIACAQALAPGLPPEFLCYLRHLENTDALIGRVAGTMRRRRNGVLCVFGDHVPSFPKLFDQANFADPRSDYVIWRPDHAGPAEVRNAHVLDLADLMLSAAQIATVPRGIEPLLPRESGEAWHRLAARPSPRDSRLAKSTRNIGAA